MSEAEKFIGRYEQDILSRVYLPKAIKERCRLTACLKAEDDREVYLVKGMDERKMILKIRAVGRPDSLEREYQILKELSHPQLPEVFFYMEEAGKEYMLRSYIMGRSLETVVNEEGALSEKESIRILLSFCDVIEYLHSRKPPVIHRDIKPQNIILTPEGKCALIDFGTARLYKEANKEDTIFMGTQATAPPEQFGYGQSDERTDIYALGMLIRFLLTGSLEKESNAIYSGALKKIESKCTAFDPDKRYANIHRVIAALKFVLHRKKTYKVSAAVFSVIVIFLAAAGIRKVNTGVEFSSPLLEQAIRQELDIPPNETIPKNRLSEVRQITICGNDVLSDWTEHSSSHYDMKNDSTLWSGKGDIFELKELKQLPNLEALVLDYQDISDITPLADMQLKYLSLCGNPFTDLTALAEIKTLQALWLEDVPVSDASVLAQLTSLQELEISGTNLADAEDFCRLPLESLKMGNTLITDLSPLRWLRGLTVLNAGTVNEQGMETIQTMTQLEYLTVSGRLENLEGFSGFQRLKMLDVSMSRLKSLEGVEKLPHLEYMGFGYTEPDSLEPLTRNKVFYIAEMVGAEIEDYTPLLRCENLREVHVGLSQKEETERQLKGSGLKIYAWEG